MRWRKGKIRRYKGKSACFRLGTGPRAAGQGSCTQPGWHGVASSVRVEDQEVRLAVEAIACNGRSFPCNDGEANSAALRHSIAVLLSKRSDVP